jgi:hypothetical protein
MTRTAARLARQPQPLSEADELIRQAWVDLAAANEAISAACAKLRALHEGLGAAMTALDSPLAETIFKLAAERDGFGFYGTATELLARLNDSPLAHLVPQVDALPKDPTRLSGALRRLAPALRAAGVIVEFKIGASHAGKKRVIWIRRPFDWEG